MGGFASSAKKFFRAVACIIIALAVFYLAFYMMHLLWYYAAPIALLIGGTAYILFSGYNPPESVKRGMRILFAVAGAVIIAYFGFMQRYDIKIIAGMAIITFVVLAVFLEKGRGTGGHDDE